MPFHHFWKPRTCMTDFLMDLAASVGVAHVWLNTFEALLKMTHNANYNTASLLVYTSGVRVLSKLRKLEGDYETIFTPEEWHRCVNQLCLLSPPLFWLVIVHWQASLRKGGASHTRLCPRRRVRPIQVGSRSKLSCRVHN